MRLDEFLVLRGFFTSRTKAQRAIKAGHVLVNGTIIKKPSFRIKQESIVNVISDVYEKPIGYFKLKNIEDQIGEPIFVSDIHVLDLGSSAGGFVIYALEKGASFVLGVEYSHEFKKKLLEIKKQYPKRVEFLFGDAIELYQIIKENYSPFDVITCDITADPKFTLNIVNLYSSIISLNGYIIFTLKLSKPYLQKSTYSELLHVAKLKLVQLQLTMLRVIYATNKKEVYVVAKRSKKSTISDEKST